MASGDGPALPPVQHIGRDTAITSGGHMDATIGHRRRQPETGWRGQGVLRRAVLLGAVLATAACGTFDTTCLIPDQPVQRGVPEDRPDWARDVQLLTTPLLNTRHTAAPGTVATELGYTPTRGGLIALRDVTILRDGIEYDIRADTRFAPGGQQTDPNRLVYCYRLLCLTVDNTGVRFADGRPADVPRDAFLLIPPNGRILALGRHQMLLYLGQVDDDLRFRYRDLYNGEEQRRLDLTVAADGGADIRCFGLQVDIAGVEDGALVYHVIDPFSE